MREVKNEGESFTAPRRDSAPDLGRTFLPCVLGVKGVERGGMCSGRNAVGEKVDLRAKSRISQHRDGPA